MTRLFNIFWIFRFLRFKSFLFLFHKREKPLQFIAFTLYTIEHYFLLRAAPRFSIYPIQLQISISITVLILIRTTWRKTKNHFRGISFRSLVTSSRSETFHSMVSLYDTQLWFQYDHFHVLFRYPFFVLIFNVFLLRVDVSVSVVFIA